MAPSLSKARAYFHRVIPEEFNQVLHRSPSVPIVRSRHRPGSRDITAKASSVFTTNDISSNPPRVLLLGASSTGKSTFLRSLQTYTTSTTNASISPSPYPPQNLVHSRRGSRRSAHSKSSDSSSASCTIEELPITPSHTAVFSDIPASDSRRLMRLHFSNSIKDADFAILFFIDATAPTGPALEELAYTATYARERSKGNLRFIGVVLSKVDLLPANPDELIISENPELQNSPVATAIRTRKVILQPIREEGKETRQTAVSRIKREVGEVLKEVIMLEETTWCVFDGRGNPRWNLGNEEAAGEIVDILSARIGRPGPGRSLSPSGRLKRWDTVRLEIGRWGSVRTAAPVDPRSED